MIAGALLVAALGGGGVGWWLGRRRPVRGVGASVAPHLLPDPALDWLRRAHGALGVWVAELDPEDEGPRAERIVDAERLTVKQIVAVDRRLEQARDAEESGTERLDGGMLVFRAAAGTAVGVLLSHENGHDGLNRAGDDLQRLLEGVRRKPQTVAEAQARTREASFESVASVGLRLAYQLERILVARGLGAEVAVAATYGTDVRIVGISGRADRRLLDSLVPVGSEVARVAQGAARGATGGDAVDPLGDAAVLDVDPLGGAVADRRQRAGTAYVFPIRPDAQATPVGAVVIWLGRDDALALPIHAELHEALTNAAPRLARALAAERDNQGSTVDTLTGLRNRGGLEELLAGPDVPRGALVTIDLDRFKLLNDSLGQAAGDAALVHVARILHDQIRAGDIAARIGGEEFALWLPGADLDVGARVAERVRIRIGTTPWDWRGRSWPLSASFGVALFSGADRDVQVVLRQSDDALRVAKHSGRNRVEKAG